MAAYNFYNETQSSKLNVGSVFFENVATQKPAPHSL